ncbi:MAG: adenylate/guanylate cyclase domain-containing protein [Chromatiaceae bacterium]
MAKSDRVGPYREPKTPGRSRGLPVYVEQRRREDETAELEQLLLTVSRSLERSYREAEVLLDVTHKINAGLLLNDVLDYVYEAFRPLLPYDRIALALLEEDNSIVRASWVRSEAEHIYLPRGYAARLAGSSLQAVLESGQPRILNDLTVYLKANPDSEPTALLAAEAMRSSLTCPMVAMGKPIGFLFFSSTEPNRYRDVHVDTFRRVAGQLAVVVEKSRLYEELLRERERTQRLLRSILPRPVADRVDGRRQDLAEGFDEVTVLFADLVDFTEWSSRMLPRELVHLLNEIFLEFDDLTDRFQIEKIKTSGDCYIAASGLPLPRHDHAQAAAEMALAMLEVVRGFRAPEGEPIQLRVGMHTGPLVAGVIGRKKFTYDIWGDTVNMASRLESYGVPGRIQVSAATFAHLSSAYRLQPQGRVQVKGKGTTETFLLVGRR